MISSSLLSVTTRLDCFQMLPDELLPGIFFQLEESFNVTLLLNKSLHNRVLKMVRIDEESALKEACSNLSKINGVAISYKFQVSEKLDSAMSLRAIDQIVIDYLIEVSRTLRQIPLKRLRELSQSDQGSVYSQKILAIAMANAKVPKKSFILEDSFERICKELTNLSNWPELTNQVSKEWALKVKGKENSRPAIH